MSEVTGEKPFPLLDVKVNRKKPPYVVVEKGTYATGQERKKLLLQSIIAKIKVPCSEFCSAGKEGGGERAKAWRAQGNGAPCESECRQWKADSLRTMIRKVRVVWLGSVLRAAPPDAPARPPSRR
jgi:hypothetical protein